jgi:hypothetical protein
MYRIVHATRAIEVKRATVFQSVTTIAESAPHRSPATGEPSRHRMVVLRTWEPACRYGFNRLDCPDAQLELADENNPEVIEKSGAPNWTILELS